MPSSEDELDDDIDLGALECAKKTPQATSSRAVAPSPPATLTRHALDPEALQTYIYPTNLPIRDYQYNIVARCFYHNTLVALPTGLGKTFIASTVILNFNRWFPRSKIIFMAPTKPLVAQQIKACCGTTGIEASKVAILLDKTRRNRADIWADKQVFFTTPQVVENDLAAGSVDPKSIVLLLIDEAHRSKGNYAYNNVARFISRFNSNYRIVAMTATPSSTVEGVQEIIDNLKVSKMEVRTERSIDIFRYLKRKTVERVLVDTSDEVAYAMDLFGEAVSPILKLANEKQVYEVRDFRHINHFTAIDTQRRILANKNIPEGLKWANHSMLSVLAMAGQCIKRLNLYGVRSFYSYFSEKHAEFTAKFNSKKSKTSMAAKLHFHPSIKKLMTFCEAQVQKPGFLGHRKLEIVIRELQSFYQEAANPDSRVIVFTEFRQSALDIVRAIEANQQGVKRLKPHIFIGQAKERDRFDEEVFSSKGKEKKPKDPSMSSSEQAQISGMNQKLQKETIKQFKKGTYNILVATSIGEEGLDIGEVDLIICYDCTSSPIKNIQRMGRTGRNRDGKVLALFSGNEETKFDKAMGGYEYIQQHIMNGNMVDLHEQVRVIPTDFEPKVVEAFIEIPDENVELKNEDDEDEIIKIASKYMAKPSQASKRSSKKPSKLQKRFFMPDNAVTGFQSASSVLKGDEQRAPDLLDKLLDSDVDDFEDLQDDPMFNTQQALTDRTPEDAAQEVGNFRRQAEVTRQAKATSSMSRSTASLGTKRGPIDSEVAGNKKARMGAERERNHKSTDGSESEQKKDNSSEEYKVSAKLGSKLGSKVGSEVVPEFVSEVVAEVGPENKNAESSEMKISETKEDVEKSETNMQSTDATRKFKGVMSNANFSNGSSDEFSDDDEILALVRRTQSFDKTIREKGEDSRPTEPGEEQNKEERVPEKEGQPANQANEVNQANKANETTNEIPRASVHVVADSDGILTKEEVMELYMNYYTPLDPRDMKNCYVPSNVSQEAEVTHTSRALRFLAFHEKIRHPVKSLESNQDKAA